MEASLQGRNCTDKFYSKPKMCSLFYFGLSTEDGPGDPFVFVSLTHFINTSVDGFHSKNQKQEMFGIKQNVEMKLLCNLFFFLRHFCVFGT